jgi:predicted phosphoribosyltransferase
VEAGRFLASELSLRHLTSDAVVLALTRGGLPVGLSVAERLSLPLDIVVAAKVPVPWQPELVLGALAGTGRVLDKRMVDALAITAGELDEIVTRQQEEMRRKEQSWRGIEPVLNVERRTAILIDDGLATGNTMLAAIRYVRTLSPARIIVAVPVGSEGACHRIRREVDELVCLLTPKRFVSLGEWYRDFEPVADSDVHTLLLKIHRQFGMHPFAGPGAAGPCVQVGSPAN